MVVVVGGTFDFRVTPNFMLDVNLDVEFDNYCLAESFDLLMRVRLCHWLCQTCRTII